VPYTRDSQVIKETRLLVPTIRKTGPLMGESALRPGTVQKVHNRIFKCLVLALAVNLLCPVSRVYAAPSDMVSLSAVIRTSTGGLAIVTATVSAAASGDTLSKWDDSYDVISAGVNARRSIVDSASDPEVGNQWGYSRLGGEALNAHTQGKDVVVAVLDTGVDASHPELEGRVLEGWDSMNPQGKGTRDPNGHGTHVAGIIAATSNNGVGVAGIAPQVSILPVRVLDSSGNGDDDELALGIIWAADQGADVLNISIGGAVPSDLLEGALDYALNKGAVVVVASGNDAMVGNKPSYPGAYPQVLTVGATDSTDKRAAFSNTGSYVDISAPGSWIRSTWPGGRYQWSSGTSMATPFVAGSAALLISAGKGSGAEVTSLLKSSAYDLGPAGRDDQFGEGLVNPLRALGLPEVAPPQSTIPFMPSLLPPGVTLPGLPEIKRPELPSLPKLEVPVLKPLPPLVKPELPVLTKPDAPKLPGLKLPSPDSVTPGLTKPDYPEATKPDAQPGANQPPVLKNRKHVVTVETTSSLVGKNMVIRVRLKGLRALTAYAETYVIYAGKTYKIRTDARSSAVLKVPYSSRGYVVSLKESPFIDATTVTVAAQRR